MKRIILAAVTVLLAAATVYQQYILQDPLRLHVIANSDTAYDQCVKLSVRDAVLEAAGDSFGMAASAEEAKRTARENAELLERAANAALAEEGASYTARVQLGVYEFPEKSYGGIVFPAGSYDAVRVVLGAGEGQNWWCVMYPPLCVTGGKSSGRVRLKSAVAEWLRRII